MDTVLKTLESISGSLWTQGCNGLLNKKTPEINTDVRKEMIYSKRFFSVIFIIQALIIRQQYLFSPDKLIHNSGIALNDLNDLGAYVGINIIRNRDTKIRIPIH